MPVVPSNFRNCPAAEIKWMNNYNLWIQSSDVCNSKADYGVRGTYHWMCSRILSMYLGIACLLHSFSQQMSAQWIMFAATETQLVKYREQLMFAHFIWTEKGKVKIYSFDLRFVYLPLWKRPERNEFDIITTTTQYLMRLSSDTLDAYLHSRLVSPSGGWTMNIEREVVSTVVCIVHLSCVVARIVEIVEFQPRWRETNFALNKCNMYSHFVCSVALEISEEMSFEICRMRRKQSRLSNAVYRITRHEAKENIAWGTALSECVCFEFSLE